MVGNCEIGPLAWLLGEYREGRFAGLGTGMKTSVEVTVMVLQTLPVVTGIVVLQTLTGVSGDLRTFAEVTELVSQTSHVVTEKG